jgi:hypothetical protein
MLSSTQKEVAMRARFSSVNWRHLLYVGATLATTLLAAGAKWRNH